MTTANPQLTLTTEVRARGELERTRGTGDTLVTRRRCGMLAKAANLFARDYFTGGSRNTGTRPLITLYSIGSGTNCYWINSQGDVNCGGVICFLGMIYMRAPINAAASMSADTAPVGTESVGTLSSLIATWDCADGGGLSMDDNGSVTYHMPGGSGGGGGGGGGGGDCSNPTPGDTNPDGSPVQDELRSLSASCEVETAPLNCNPAFALDTTCIVPLTPDELADISDAWATLRPTSEFTVDSIRDMCVSLKARFDSLMASGKVFAGKPSADENHDAAELGSIIHIDQDFLAAAHANMTTHNAALAGLALHEAAHSIKKADGSSKYDHPLSEFPYTTYPFPFTSPQQRGAPNSCTK